MSDFSSNTRNPKGRNDDTCGSGSSSNATMREKTTDDDTTTL